MNSPNDPKNPRFEDLVLPLLKDWVEAEPFPRGHTKHSFISGDRTSLAIRVRYFKHRTDGTIHARAWFGPETEGPPGHVHGGAQASLLDEVMGAAAWLSGHKVLAAKLEINFRKPLPLLTVLTARSRIERIDGKKVYVRSELVSDADVILSEGSGLFVVINPAELVAVKSRSVL